MMSFSVKPGDKTDETESPNLVNKTELKGEYLPKLFFLSTRCSEKFLTEGGYWGSIGKKILSRLADFGL